MKLIRRTRNGWVEVISEIAGVRRSTVEDVARRSGLGRATVYRRFANKDLLVDAVVLAEVRRYFDGYARALARSSDIGDQAAETTAYTVRFLREHALLNRLMDTEPETLLPHLSIDGGAILAFITEQSTTMWLPLLYPGSEPTAAQRRHLQTVTEVQTRLVLSFILTRDTGIDLDGDDATRAFARDYLVPMLVGERA